MKRSTSVLNYADVFTERESGRRHLLLGNGFSMAWKASAFSYASLRSKADMSALSCDGDRLSKHWRRTTSRL